MLVGCEEAGDNIAGLYSLTATCEANRVEPIAYLTDVLPAASAHTPQPRSSNFCPTSGARRAARGVSLTLPE